jgi:hypothetical protein
MQRRIFGLEKEESRGIWRKLHKGEFRKLCSSPRNIRMMRQVGHGPDMGHKTMHTKFWQET